MVLAAIFFSGVLLWIVGMFLPAQRTFKTSKPVYLPIYLARTAIDQHPFPEGIRGTLNGNEFIQHLDRRGKSLLRWTRSEQGNEILWQAHPSKKTAVSGSFRYVLEETGIMSELTYERTLVINKPILRLMGLMISLRKEANRFMKPLQPDPGKEQQA